jgi:hypothetical protein
MIRRLINMFASSFTTEEKRTIINIISTSIQRTIYMTFAYALYGVSTFM